MEYCRPKMQTEQQTMMEKQTVKTQIRLFQLGLHCLSRPNQVFLCQWLVHVHVFGVQILYIYLLFFQYSNNSLIQHGMFVVDILPLFLDSCLPPRLVAGDIVDN